MCLKWKDTNTGLLSWIGFNISETTIMALKSHRKADIDS